MSTMPFQSAPMQTPASSGALPPGVTISQGGPGQDPAGTLEIGSGWQGGQSIAQLRQIASQQQQGKSQDQSQNGPNTAQGDAIAQMQQFLQSVGLSDPAAMAWVQQQVTAGQDATEMAVSIYQQPFFQAAFPEIKALQQAGIAVPTPVQILQTRNAYQAIQKQFGQPVSSNPSDYVSLFVNQVSPSEFLQRSQLYDKIVNVYGPRLTQGFEQYAGIKGVNNDQLYQMMSGLDGGKLAQQYMQTTGQDLGSLGHLAAGGNVQLSWQAIQDFEAKAESAQKAEFQAGGQVASGPTPATEEQTIRARTGANFTTVPVSTGTSTAGSSI